MAPPSPHECAKYLGLSPGIDGPPGKPLTSDEEERTPLLRLFKSLGTSSSEDRDIFKAQFIASYLPSFFRTLTQNSIDLELKRRPGDMTATWWFLVIWIFKSLLPNPSFERFLRGDLSRAQDLYRFVYRAIGSLQPHLFDRSSGEDWTSPILILLSYIDSLLTRIPLIDSSFAYPDLDSSTISGLRRVYPFLRDFAAHVPASLKARASRWAQMVEQFSEGKRWRIQMMVKKDENVRGGSYHWWACEFSLGNKKEEDRVECSDQGAMMACGRCRAVRYCSKGHQKLDWEKHKPLCFEPSW